MIEVNCDVCGSDEAELLLALQGSEYRRCIHCGSIFAKWIPDDYETVNETAFAADLSFSASKLRRANSAYQRKLHRFDAYRKTNRFVEIGCSAGSLLVSARNMGWQVQGVDICE
ncbi:MAG: hypothetical protein O3A63_22095, partial [Proteobacteria bacterium]|nr:hypothetical protein [Pseudomonadota bacterium]